jgi:peptidoglycan hydrolase-like protein with peptidoglycan-binding domain
MNNSILATGAFGSEVASLQELLRAKGFAVPDEEVKRGFFGPGTRGAVAAFQKANRLVQTGKVDPQTAALLALVVAAPAAPSMSVPAVPAANTQTTLGTGAPAAQQAVPAPAAPTAAALPPASAPATAAPAKRPASVAVSARPPKVTIAKPPATAVTTAPIPKAAPSPQPSKLAPVPAAVSPEQPKITGPTLSDLASVLGTQVSPALMARLAGQGITTLADVRQAGGLGKLVGAGDAAAARLIEVHADLARVSVNLTANAGLIAAGYDSTQKIAAAPRPTFLAAAAPLLGLVGAARVQVVATSMYRALDQVVTAAQVDSANGRSTGLSDDIDKILHPVDLTFCQCCDCQAAQSPAAYLADLIGYVVANLQNQSLPISLQFLVDRFHQPFADLPTDCEAVEQQVTQVRICVEVLRSYLGSNPFPTLSSAQDKHTPTPGQQATLATAQAAYILAAYSALLNGIGTSFQELRLSRNADTKTRVALAGRLGLTIDPYGASRPDALDHLLLEPASPPQPPAPPSMPPDSHILTEGAIERVFGLADTTRNPLSDGLTLQDSGGVINRWNLTGVAWGKNTASDGKIYVSLSQNGSTQTISLYRDAARTLLVASGQQTIAGGLVTGSIAVYEENLSGLSGTVWITGPADNTGIALDAVPLLTCWQLQTLRSDWQTGDHPLDGFSDGITAADLNALPGPITLPPGYSYESFAQVLIVDHVVTLEELVQLLSVSPITPAYTTAVKSLYVQSQRLPVIDPDVIGPDDFRVPLANAQSNVQPFDIWLNRRTWVDSFLKSMNMLANSANMFSLMGAQLAYTTITSSPITTTTIPWSTATPPSVFESLWENLAEGVDVLAITLQLSADLGLTIDAFNRMMDIVHQEKAAAVDPAANPAVTPDAWTELSSILAQAAKTRFFDAWRDEEQSLPVEIAGQVFPFDPPPASPPMFGSQAFVVSLTEPAVGDWPPSATTKPLIDPALVPFTGLPDPTIGHAAIHLWRQRSKQVAQLTQTLRTTRESLPSPQGLQAALQLALGSPLPVDLDSLAQQLLDPASAGNATATIQNTLFMSVEDFDSLMTIRAMDADPTDGPTAAQWIELYGILTAAQTQRTLYKTWLDEEAAAGMKTAYWKALKAALPLWRGTADQRSQWHAALAQRTSAPIIDPDIIGPSDLSNPTTGDPAFDLWNKRHKWVQSQLPTGPAPTNPTVDVNVDPFLNDSLGITGKHLAGLATLSDAGTDITSRLAQLGLTYDAFTALAGLRKLVQGGVPVLQSEWCSFYSILAQVTKQQMFAAWNQQETAQNIILGPDLFQLPASNAPASCGASTATSCCPTAPPPPLPAWRATAEARQAWEDTLTSRIEQQATATTAVENVAGSAEGATLTKLRDALIMATDAPGSCVCDKADWITTNLMIDAQTSGCQETTRIEQAIETLQGVMNGVRDGLIGDSGTGGLSNIDNSNFDEEWSWMGAYSMWKAAILVFMYPENILDPTLRKWQTPAFQKLVSDVRSSANITPEQACQFAETYLGYFHDVCTLTIRATCEASTEILSDGGSCDTVPTNTFHELIYMIANGASGAVYWSAYDEYNPPDPSVYRQTFWDVVPGLTGEQVTTIIGATPFATDLGKRYVFLFMLARDGVSRKLVFTRYDLDNQIWDSGDFPLALPPMAAVPGVVSVPPAPDITILTQTDATAPPTLLFTLSATSVLVRSLNLDGTDWGASDWQVATPVWSDWTPIPTSDTDPSLAQVVVDKAKGPIGTGAATSPPFAVLTAAQSGTSSRVNLFAVASDSTVLCSVVDTSVNPAEWQPWETMGQKVFDVSTYNASADHRLGPYAPQLLLATTITAIKRDENHIDIFVIGDDGNVWHNSCDVSGWNEWEQVSLKNASLNSELPALVISPLCTSVAATSATPDTMDIFIFNLDGDVFCASWNEGNSQPWQPWSQINKFQSGIMNCQGRYFCMRLKAIASGPDRIHVFGVHQDGTVLTMVRDGGDWVDDGIWQPIGPSGTAMLSYAAVTAVSGKPDHLDIFIIGADATIKTTSWDSNPSDSDGTWGTWQPVGDVVVEGYSNAAGEPPPSGTMSFPLTVAAVAREGASRIDIFALQKPSNGGLTVVLWSYSDANIDSGNWQPFESIGNAHVHADVMDNTSIAVVALDDAHLNVFIVTNDGVCQVATLSPAGESATGPAAKAPSDAFPTVSGPFQTSIGATQTELQTRRAAIENAFTANTLDQNLEYLKEANSFVPVYLAEQLQAQGQYRPALDWFRTVYDYTAPEAVRDIYYGFEREKSPAAIGTPLSGWLSDPLNPHLIAATRQYAYSRYTVLTIAQCMNEYADALFTYDTSESDAQARVLYMTALALLSLEIFDESKGPCAELPFTLQPATAVDQQWSGVQASLLRDISELNRASSLATVVPQIQKALATDAPPASRFAAARALLSQAKRRIPRGRTIGSTISDQSAYITSAYSALLSSTALDPAVTGVTLAAGNAFDAAAGAVAEPSVSSIAPEPSVAVGKSGAVSTGIAAKGVAVDPQEGLVLTTTVTSPNGSTSDGSPAVRFAPPKGPIYVPAISYGFCIPPDPLIDSLRQHAELNLHNLRNCMNISGITRQIDPYSAPTDVASGLPSIGSGGQLLLPGAVVIQPTPYSYSVLLARAKQLAQTAAQMEASMLSALQQQDQATYDELQARQNLAVANATVQLQSLTATQATDGVTLAQLQQQQTQITTDHWQQMLGSDVAGLEQSAITAMQVERGLQVASAFESGQAAIASGLSVSTLLNSGKDALSSIASALSSAAGAAGTTGQIDQANASLEVQQDDWQYQYQMGVQSGVIAAQQIADAEDQVRIAAQQLSISQLQATNSENVLNFLTNKFTNAALYQWMSGVLQGVYSYFLRQATAVAKLAENQMAFERQQVPPGFIQADYWQPPSAVNLNSSSSGSNTQGLTGAERLTEDIEQLDDYYFSTDQRKLQLTKTLSLAQLFPIAFQQLRETGVMNFTTSMTLFDQDFPGHYLRLIQQVSVSVIALIPPTMGIKATLSTTGATYTVTGPQVFGKVVVSRAPQSIAITSPTNATGVFAVDPQANLLLPFQGLGVEAQWQFSMPQAANPIDYKTLADVQVTFNYTALDSPEYRAQVLRALDNETSADAPYSFVNDLADQWYDLNNPDQTATPMTVQFTTARTDFPPNLNDIRIQQVVLYFSLADGFSLEVSVGALRFAEGISTSSVDDRQRHHQHAQRKCRKLDPHDRQDPLRHLDVDAPRYRCREGLVHPGNDQ